MRDTIVIERNIFTPKSTLSRLLVQGELFCWALEDTCRGAGIKVYGETAIPQGRYRMMIENSPRYNRDMPRLYGVPMWPHNDVLIHWGNSPMDSKGCILVGEKTSIPDWIAHSHATFDRLFTKLLEIRTDEMFVDVVGGLPFEKMPQPAKEVV